MGIFHWPYDFSPSFSFLLPAHGADCCDLGRLLDAQPDSDHGAAKPKHDWTKSYFRAYMILLPFSDTFFYLSSVVNRFCTACPRSSSERVPGRCCATTLTFRTPTRRSTCVPHGLHRGQRPLCAPPRSSSAASRHSSASAKLLMVFLSTFSQRGQAPSLNLRS